MSDKPIFNVNPFRTKPVDEPSQETTQEEESTEPVEQPPVLEQLSDELQQLMPSKTKEEGIVKYQLDVEPEIQALRADLLGGYFSKVNKDAEGNPLFIKASEPKMNKEGVEALLLMVLRNVGRNTSLSQGDENSLSFIKKSIAKKTISTIWNPNSQKRFNIDLIYKDFISEAIQSFVEWSVNRAKDGGTFKLINTNVNVNEQHQSMGMAAPKRGGVTGLLSGGNY